MHRNINNGVHNTKNIKQTYLSYNNISNSNIGNFTQSNIYQISSSKNIKQIFCKKNGGIQRHYSEEDFKKGVYGQQGGFEESGWKVQEEYFPGWQFGNENGSKVGRSITKVNKKKQCKDKTTLDGINFRMNGLKQTSSTQSAQNLPKRIPFYIKNKFRNASRYNDHYNNKNSFQQKNIKHRQNYKIICKLGQGKFGKVFMVKQIFTGFILAMKIIQKKKIIKENLLEQFIRQLSIQTFLNHPNIISLYGFFSDQIYFYTLMELGCDGQLYSLILNKKLLSQQSTSFIIKNLLQAISYIHDNKVLHRDIKPQNIVLIMGNVKICDFGWAVHKLHQGELRNTFCGTPLYLSPEILQGSSYDEKVDLWAIGILAYELYLGCNPFDVNTHEDLSRIFTETIKFPVNKEISEEFKKFIVAMLMKNPNQRSNSKKLLKMEFIAKYKDFETCEQLCR